MPLAVLLSVMALAFTTLIASTVTRQILDTRSDVQRAQGIAAAQAGLDVAMARILSEHNELYRFVVEDLPDEPIEGDTGSGEYRVTVAYFDADPHGRDDGWRSANGVPSASVASRYAVVTSVGTDGHGGSARTLTATFAFPVSGTLLGGEARPRLLDVMER